MLNLGIISQIVGDNIICDILFLNVWGHTSSIGKVFAC